MSHKEHKSVWSDAPLFKITNREVAEQLLSQGKINKLNDVYVELNPVRQKALENARSRWDIEGRNAKIQSLWSDAPLPSQLSRNGK